MVVHHVDGYLSAEAVNQFAFLASNEDESDASFNYGETAKSIYGDFTFLSVGFVIFAL